VAGDQKRFKIAMIHAERFSEQGNWQEAIRAYRFALAEFPNNEAAIIGFAKGTLALGQTELAWRALNQVLKVNPVNYEALTYIANIQERNGQLEAAAETYLRVGNVFATQSDLAAAVEAWMQAIELVPEKIDAHQKLAEAFTHLSKPRLAARQMLVIAAIYQNRGDETSALQWLHEAQILLPKEPGLKAAFEALEQGQPIEPDEIGDDAVTDLDLASDDYTDSLESNHLFDEDLFSVESELLANKSAGGLITSAQQRALEELAGVIFEDDSQHPLAATISRDQMNLLIVQAIELQQQEKFTEAINTYRQVTQAGAGRPALYFNLGVLFKNQGQYPEAAKMFKMAAQEKVYRVGAQFALGQTYYASGNLELALRHFLETLKIIDLGNATGSKVESLTQTYENLTDDYVAQVEPKRVAGLAASLDKFFASPNWDQKAIEARGRMDSVSEDGVTMSLAEFLEAPETEVMITTIALTDEYVKRNFLMTASEECLRAIQKAPTYLPLHVRLADILIKQEHIEEAINKYLYVARVYKMRHQPEQAVNIYQKVLRLAPMDVTVRSKLIEMYISDHKQEEALEQYLTLADSYYQLAQVDRALERYNEALRLAAKSSQPHVWKAEILSRMGDIYNQRFDWARATTAYEDLLKLSPNDERVQRQLIDLYYKQNKVGQATKILDVLLSTYQRYDPLKTLDLLRELVSLYPDDMALRQRLAVAYVQNGMKREAIAEYDALGEMQLENGLRSQAMQTIQAIINLQPDDPEGYRRLLAQISGGAI
jgi:tetratricopeptide (TPR) repeat protein